MQSKTEDHRVESEWKNPLGAMPFANRCHASSGISHLGRTIFSFSICVMLSLSRNSLATCTPKNRLSRVGESIFGADDHIRCSTEKAAPHPEAGVRCAPWPVPCVDDADASPHADERPGESALRVRLLGRGLRLTLWPACRPRLHAAGAGE